MFNAFDAVFDDKSEVLILGSFPSVKSREQGFYYGNKQNRFWRTLEKIFNEKIPDDIPEKKAFLLRHHIALYDAVASSDLVGSADDTLQKSNLKPSDISFLLPPHTKVQKIVCNGKAAYKILMQNLHAEIKVVCLPSTSSANPNFDFEMWNSELKNLK